MPFWNATELGEEKKIIASLWPRPGFAISRAIANAVRKPKEPW